MPKEKTPSTTVYQFLKTPLLLEYPKTDFLRNNYPYIILTLTVIIFLIPKIFIFFNHSFQVINYPYQLDYDEGFNLSASWQWSHLVNIYLPNTPDHFIAAGYPPLYYLLSASLIKFFGMSLQGGRIVGFVSSLSIGLLIALLSHNLITQYFAEKKGSWITSWIIGVSWFALAPVQIWSSLYKQDMVGLALALFGLYLLDYKNPTKMSLFLAAIIFTLAILTKQNMLIAPVSAVLFLLFQNWRQALGLVAWCSGLLGLTWVLLQQYSQGGAFEHIFLIQAMVSWRWEDFTNLLFPLLVDHWAFLGLSVFFLVFRLIKQPF